MNTILFGFGRAGKIHYNNLLENNNFNLTHVIELYDITSEIKENIKFVNINDKHKISNLMEDNNIKMVIVASPTKTHYEITKMALNNNKHVFIEKPLTNNLDEINECFNLAEQNNLKLFVGYNRRYDPTIRQIKEDVKNNKIGKINYALTISHEIYHQIFLKSYLMDMGNHG